MSYKVWRLVSLIISGIIALVVNPATFGLGPTKNVPLNIAIRAAIFLIVYLILSKIGKPKKEN